MSKAARYTLSARATVTGQKVQVSYTVDKRNHKDILNVAWVQHEIKNHILRGENKDLTLQHYNVVRAFEQQPLGEWGELEMTLPGDVDPAGGSVVLYIQNTGSMAVLGATEISPDTHNAP